MMSATRQRAGRIGIVGASALIVLLATQGSGVAQRTAWSFEDFPPGRPPAGFLFASSPKDQSGQWTVVRDGTNTVLGQLRHGPSGIQLAVVEGPSFADLVLSVRVRLLEGARSAGVVWHYRDADNYYLARLDLQEQDVRIYRVVAGQRTRLEEEDDLELEAGAWHLIKVEHRGTRMRLLINGVPVGDARDRTGQEAGAVGLWTSDSSAWFDDLSVQPAPGERGRGDRQD
jgi:hypothetical protein